MSTQSRMMAGALAGTMATLPMTATMLASEPLMKRHERWRLPPEEVFAGLLQQTGVPGALPGDAQETAAMAAHYLFGAAAGALFGLVAPATRASRVGAGVCFGLGVCAGSYLGWLPATGLRHPPERDSWGRAAQLAMSHVVWGASTGVAYDMLEPSPAAVSEPATSSPAPAAAGRTA